MPVKFEGGEVFDGSDWDRMMRMISSGAREGKQPTEIVSSDGVTIKTGNLKIKKDAKMPLAKPNYIEGRYKDWTIRVWREANMEVFACNYFRNGDARYFEVSYGEVRDENGVFKYAEQYIDQIRGQA